MNAPKPGEVGSWCWHVHHEILVECLTEPLSVRQDYVRENKDAAETELEIDTMNRSIKNLIAFHRFVLYSIVLSGLEEPSTGQIHSALGNFCRLKGIRSVSLARVSQIITSLSAEGYLNTRCVNRGMKGGNTRLITLAPHVDRATLRDLAVVELKSG